MLAPVARQNLIRAVQHLQKGEAAAAAALCRQLLVLAPRAPDALHVLAMAQDRLGESDAAIATLRQALAQRRDFPEAAADLANLLLGRDRAGEAAEVARKALRAKPDDLPLLNALGLALRRLLRFPEAAQVLERAVARYPNLREARHNLANVYRHLDRDEDAERVWRAVIAEHADFAEAIHDLGALMKDLGRFEEAELLFRRALALRPDYDAAAKALGILLLARNRLHEGWGPYERRLTPAARRLRPEPDWDGSPLDGRTLLIWGEQGIGDQVLFASLLPILLERESKIRLAVESRLIALMRRSFPTLEVVLRQDGVVQGDVQCAISSLGMRLDIGPEHLPAATNYLKADPVRQAELRRRYGEGFLVGLSWHSKNADFGHRKSAALSDLAPILSVPGLTFVNLQYGADAEDLAGAARRGTPVIDDSAIDPLHDLDGFAAQVAAMDLVVSVSNSTVHFAGALGIPCWVMLPAGLGLLWYWGHADAKCPWYPSIRIFRQGKTSGWSEPIAAMAGELARRNTTPDAGQEMPPGRFDPRPPPRPS